MMLDRRALLAAGLALSAGGPALALDVGMASGGYRDEDAAFEFRHALALDMDNAEGLSSRPRQIRLLLSDREVAPAALYGVTFPPVWTMAKAGSLKGLLLEFDPADRENLTATILSTPEPGYSLGTLTQSDSSGLWARLELSPTRIVGELKAGVSEKMNFKFSAPVFTNPVVADLKGAAVATSEPVKVMIARAEALDRGDMATARALSTPTAGGGLSSLPPEMMKNLRGIATELTHRLKTAKRVVIRRETAVVIFGEGEWGNAARVDGVWKAAD